MKIAIDTRELQGNATGVGRLVSQLLAAWNAMPEARAHDFVELTPSGSTEGGGTLWEQMVLPALARDAGADVLFAPAYSGPIRPPMPMVVAIHDVSFAAHPEWFAWREGARRRTVVQLAARAAARIITISQFSKREIVAHLGVDESKIAVAYPGVPPITGGTSHIGSSHGCSILFVGSIFNRRHVPELIQGFARLACGRPEVTLNIVGDNRTTPYIDLEAMMPGTGVSDRIHLRSYVPDNELRGLYSNAGAFAFLSEYEGFGLTPLEALAAGVPVVLIDTPVARETCGDAAVYVPRPDPLLIERALTALLFDSNERARVLDASKDVLARYSWTGFAKQVLDVLLEAGRH